MNVQNTQRASTSNLTEKLAAKGGYSMPEVDPLRGFYGIVSAVLILEAICTWLAITVTAKNICHPVAASLVLVVLGFCMVFLCAGVKKPWFWAVNILLQLGVLLAGGFHIGISVMGIFFIATWIYVVIVDKKIESKIASGQLKGQVPLSASGS